MGGFLKSLQTQKQEKVDFLDFFNYNSLTKLKEYYSSFKSLSETYSIDNEEFAELFPINYEYLNELFDCLDTDHNLLIDGLQLFTGLALLSSNILFKDKIMFIFKMFDFNSLRSISRTDIEFMVLSACNVVSKIFKIVYEDIFVEQFIRTQFPKDERVNISQMVRWACVSESVSTFFGLIGHASDNDPGTLIAQKLYLTLTPLKITSVPVAQKIEAKEDFFVANSYKLFKSLDDEQDQFQIKGCDFVPEPSWVYGIRFKDVKQFIELTDKELVYFVGKVVILYNTYSRKQRHYLDHRQQIISVAKFNNLIATGEYGKAPQIKIWNSKTLQTVSTLCGHHLGVHLLQFLKGLIVSCGCGRESPILIHSLETGQILFSTYANWPTVDITILQNFTTRTCEQFIVASLYGIDHFEVERGGEGIKTNMTSLRESEVRGARITCVCFFMINSNLQQLREYDQKVQKFLLAGYDNGEVSLWNIAKGNKEYVFSHEGSQILGIIPTHSHLYIVTNSTLIICYDIVVQHKRKVSTVDLTQINQELATYDICNFKQTGRGLLLITRTADVVLINPHQPQPHPTLSHFNHQVYEADKISHIFALSEEIVAQKLIRKDKERTLFIAEGRSIHGIDVQSHSMVRQWNVGHPISAFDVLVLRNLTYIIVAGVRINSQLSYLCSQNDFSQSPSREEIPGDIISILLHAQQNSNYVIVLASTPNALYKYSYSKGSFAKATFLTVAYPTPRLTTLDNSSFLISNANNEPHSLIANRQQYQIHAQTIPQNSLSTLCPLKQFFYFGTSAKESLVCIVGRKIKSLIASRLNGNIDLWSSYEELMDKNSVTLKAHTSLIADASLTEDQRVLFTSGCTDGMIVQWRVKLGVEKGSATKGNRQYEQLSVNNGDDSLMKKIEYCRFDNDVLNQVYDQHLLISGIKHQNIRRLFKASLHESKNICQTQEPTLSLKLDYAFGIQTFHKNNTMNLLDSKRLIYFVGKLIVIYEIQSNSQRFYRGHRFKVTCFHLLSDKMKVISGQAAYRPVINIWSVQSLETLVFIQTDHIGGIIELAVSGSVLLSYGMRGKRTEQEQGERNLYSYQAYDYEHRYCLAYRSQKDVVYAMALDPTNPYRFATCSEGRVSFWQISANSIYRRNICYISQDSPTACVFYTPLGIKTHPDLIIGTRSGSLGVVSRERYWCVFKKGENESKMVNCLLVVKRKGQTLILVSSEDNYLRGWNQSFEQVFQYNLLKDDHNVDFKKIGQLMGKEELNRSIQSISLVDSNKLTLIAATRSCEIIELQIKDKVGFKNCEILQTFITRFSGGAIQKARGKVLISHHPRHDILATLGQDHVVIFWNCEQGTILHTSELGLDKDKTQPTALKFSHNGDYLIIGLSDGLLLYLDSKMSKTMQGKGGDSKYSEPSLKMVAKQKAEQNYAVVGIQLSQGGEFLAVSYHYLTSQRSVAEIKIFASKLKDNKMHRLKQLENQKIYELHSTVDNPHLQHSYISGGGNICGFAACNMSFAQHQGGHYLLMFFQLLDESQSRVWASESEQGVKYKIRHVNNKTDSANSSSLNELIKWKKPFMHSAITAHYLLQSRSSLDAPLNNHLRIPEFTASLFMDGHLLAASQNGDLHLLRTSAIDARVAVAKTLPAHTCIISQIEHNHDRTVIYTAGERDQSVLRWIVQGPNTQNIEEDQNQARDIFGEIPDLPQIKRRMVRYEAKFKTVGLGMSPKGFVQQVRVRQILGRSSYGARNNIKVDRKGRLIFCSGQAIILGRPSDVNKQFLYLPEEKRLVEQVSCIEISEDGEVLIAAYSGLRAEVAVWSLSSKTVASRMVLQEITQVIYMCLSYDHSRLIVYGLKSKEAEGCLLMIDLPNQKVLATTTYFHKHSWHIRALAFLPHSLDCFLTCGVEPLKQWRLYSGQLVYQLFTSIADPTTIHTALIFAGETPITGTDEGKVVLWRNEPIPHVGHDQMITCLAVTKPHGNIFYLASGSQANSQGDYCQVLLWSFSNDQLRQLRKVTARDQTLELLGNHLGSHYEADLEVQSLWFWEDQLMIGLLKGDIYRYDCRWSEKGETGSAILQLAFEDGEKTEALFFINNQDMLVEISEHGLLRIWHFTDGQLLWAKHFETEVVNMIYSSLYEFVIIAFRSQLKFLEWGEDHCSLIEVPAKTVQFNFLTHLVLSHSQQLVALGIQTNSGSSHVIQIYDIAEKELKFKLRMYLDSPIDFIDFSCLATEKTFMLVKTKLRIVLYDISSPEEILPQQLAKKIDWLDRGLQISEKTERARDFHQIEVGPNQSMKKIAEIGKGILLVDSGGGVVIITDDQLTGRCRLGISGVDFVGVSQSGRWCAIVSKQDRNIVILQILVSK